MSGTELKRRIDSVCESARSINSEQTAQNCLDDFPETENLLQSYYAGREEPDYRIAKLLNNLKYYVAQWLVPSEYSRDWCKNLIDAIAKVVCQTAQYDLEIRDDPDAVKTRNQRQLAICDELKKQEKLSVEENLDKPYDITIFMVTYNQLELTKLCLNSVYQNTNDVSREIFLIDNGSSDGSYEYFKPDSRIKIIRLIENVGLLMALQIFYESRIDQGRFWLYMNNDVVVTPRWASQMLECIRSDPKIGMVKPYTNRTGAAMSMDCPVGLYEIDKIQEFGESFNHANPSLWTELKVMYPFIGLYRPSIKRTFGYYEDAFYYSFYYADTDYVVSIVKAGYKAVQCRDTYIHHFDGGSSNSSRKRKSLDIGEKDFIKKFGFFPTDLDRELCSYNYKFYDSRPVNILFLGFSRGNILGMVKTAHCSVRNDRSLYYSADTMERLSVEPLWENVPFEKMDSWYDIEKIFPDVTFDLILYLDNIVTMRNPLRFLINAKSRLQTNGKIIFYLENSASLPALDYTFISSRTSERDACRLRKNTLMDIDSQLEMINKSGLSADIVTSEFLRENFGFSRFSNIDVYKSLLSDGVNSVKFENSARIGGHIITARRWNPVNLDNTMEDVLYKKGK